MSPNKMLHLLRTTTFPPVVLMTVLVLAFTASSVRGDWGDNDITDIIDNVKNIKGNVSGTVIPKLNDVWDATLDGKTKVDDPKIQQMIQDTLDFMKVGINKRQDGIETFLGNDCDGSSDCGKFRANLVSMIQTIQDLSNDLLAFHPLEKVDIQLDDPGLIDVINAMPGRALYPMYRLMTKLKFFESGVLDQMKETRANLATLYPVIYETDGILPAGSLINNQPAAVLSNRFDCTWIVDNKDTIKIAAHSVEGFGVVCRGTGLICDALSKTVINGSEGDIGISGWVDAVIKQDNYHFAGKILGGFGAILIATGTTAINKVRFCEIEVRQEQILDNQGQIINNQNTIIRMLQTPPGQNIKAGKQ